MVFVAARFIQRIVSLDDLNFLKDPELTSIDVKASVFSITIWPPVFNFTFDLSALRTINST